jgi:hypothetical protein
MRKNVACPYASRIAAPRGKVSGDEDVKTAKSTRVADPISIRDAQYSSLEHEI